MTNIFVTGATGFIGSHLCRKINKRRHRVVVLVRDILPSPWRDWLDDALKNCVFVSGDLLSPKFLRRVLTEYQIREVYHFAAQAIVSTALRDPPNTFETNIMGTVNLLEACRQLDVERIYVMSTDKVYGNRLNAEETDPLVSDGGIYETSKACQDLIAQAYMGTYEMAVIIGRSCNAYGYDLARRIIPNTIKACKRAEAPIIFEGENTVRQYIYVEDLVDAILYYMRRLMKGYKLSGVFNIATPDVLTQEQVVKEICQFFPVSPRYVKREKPIHEIKQQSMIMKDFGWQPKFTFTKAIQETIKRFDRYGC